jgi:hypothetical protein
MRGGVMAAVVLLAAGCGPRQGDRMLLTAGDHVWFKKEDLKAWKASANRPGAVMNALLDRGKGGSLYEGTTVQILGIEPDAFKVRVTEDAAPDSVKSTFGSVQGKVGFVERTLAAVRVSR